MITQTDPSHPQSRNILFFKTLPKYVLVLVLNQTLRPMDE